MMLIFIRLNDIYSEIANYSKIYSSEDNRKEVKEDAKESITKLEIMRKEVENGLIIDYNSLAPIEKTLYLFLLFTSFILEFLTYHR